MRAETRIKLAASARVRLVHRAAREALFGAVPAPWRGRVRRVHERISAAPAGELGMRTLAESAADAWLADQAGRLASMRVPVDMADADVVSIADRMAAQAMSMGEVAPGVWLSDPGALRDRLAAWVVGLGYRPPDCDEPMPAIRRMTCAQWWRRAIRRVKARALEGAAIGLGYVARGIEPYASDATVERRRKQRMRNAAGLGAASAVNLDTGDEFRLADLADRSVANPRIRRGELMVRIAGFESVAMGLGHAAEFITVTCPSRFHAQRIGAGGRAEPNPAHEGLTPRDAAGYLGRVWANCRAWLWRRGVRPYGFRIAEPHHDGTPHWHMLLFVAAEKLDAMRAGIRDYFLADSPEEPGARKNRVEFVAIDRARGSAAGYVAKYVAKNVEGGGYAVQGDMESGAAIYPAERVEAWASTWGIRQFQQVGGPPVGVWRELRRMQPAGPLRVGAEYSGPVADAVAAADVGAWGRYVQVQGGPEVRRADLAVVLAKTESGWAWDGVAGLPYPALQTRYGELRAGQVYGVVDAVSGVVHESVRFRWEIKWGGFGFSAGEAGPRSPGNNCSGPVMGTGPVAGAGCGTWRPMIDGFVVPVLGKAERKTLESWKEWANGGSKQGAVGGAGLASGEAGGRRGGGAVEADGAGCSSGGRAGDHPGACGAGERFGGGACQGGLG